MRQVTSHTHTHTHIYIYINTNTNNNILNILNSVPLFNFTLSITNNNFNILTFYMYNIYVKLTSENITPTGINYKELYDCKWDRMTLKNKILNTPEFKFL